jgi:hypothetical protein
MRGSCVMLLAVVKAASLQPGTHAAGRLLQEAKIAAYQPGTDVTEHNKIDLDQAAIETALKQEPPDFAAAKAVYTGGGNSVSKGKFRTIQGFSTNAGTKLAGEATYTQFKDWYGDPDFGNIWIMAALDKKETGFAKNGDADFKLVNDDSTIIEATKKGTVYLNIWQYAIHEMEAAMKKCQEGGDATANNGAIHAWDEAVAFYTGSLQDTETTAGSGKLMYALAQKRCSNFKTCQGGSTSGVAMVNKKIFDDFTAGKTALESGVCSEMQAITDRITAQGFVPIIQGALRYAHKLGALGITGTKAKAEGGVFAAGVLPRLHGCSPADAKTVYENLLIGDRQVTDWPAVKAAFENNYACMSITCADVGGLWFDGERDYYKGAAPCGDAGLIIVIAIAAAVALAVIIAVAIWKWKRPKPNKPQFTPKPPNA